MVKTLTLLFLFQFLGELIQRTSGVPVPGPVLGMVMMLLYLMVWKKGQEQVIAESSKLLAHLPLFFIPAGAGLMLYGDLLVEQGLAIVASLVIGTVLAFMVTAKLMQRFLRQYETGRAAEPQAQPPRAPAPGPDTGHKE